MSTSNVRPANMERITTPELARKFIEEQIHINKDIKADKKYD